MIEVKTFDPKREIVQEGWDLLREALQVEHQLDFDTEKDSWGDMVICEDRWRGVVNSCAAREFLLNMKVLDPALEVVTTKHWQELKGFIRQVSDPRYRSNSTLHARYVSRAHLLFPQGESEPYLTPKWESVHKDRLNNVPWLLRFYNGRLTNDSRAYARELDYMANVQIIFPGLLENPSIVKDVQEASRYLLKNTLSFAQGDDQWLGITQIGKTALLAHPSTREVVNGVLGEEEWRMFHEVFGRYQARMLERASWVRGVVGPLNKKIVPYTLDTRDTAMMAANLAVLAGSRTVGW